MAGALLANVQTGKAEPENVHLGEQRVEGFAGEVCTDQTRANQFKVTAELGHRSVVKRFTLRCLGVGAQQSIRWSTPTGFRKLLVADLREAQPLKHKTQLETVRLKAVAGGPLFVHLRESQPIHFQGFKKWGADLAPLHGNAQLVAKPLNRAHVTLQHQLALVTGCSPGDVGRDRWIAIAIGSNPGSEGAKGRRRQLHIRVAAGQCRGEAATQLGHGIEQHLLEVVQGVIDLIQHRGLELVQLISAPPQPDFLLQLKADRSRFKGAGFSLGFELLQKACHAALLVADGVTDDLGGVSGEDQADIELLEQRLQLGRGDVQSAQTFKQFPKGCGFCLGGQGRGERVDLFRCVLGTDDALQIPVFLDALLEDVHQLEIEGKGPSGSDRFRQVHVPDQRHQSITAHGVSLGKDRVAELFHAQQALRLLGWALTAQNGLPEVLDQGQSLLQELSTDRGVVDRGHGLLALRSDCGGGGHRRPAGIRNRHDHPKA